MIQNTSTNTGKPQPIELATAMPRTLVSSFRPLKLELLMHRNIEVLDKYFKNCENREACYAYDCIRKEMVEGRKPTTNTERDEILLCDNNDFCDRRSIAGLCTNKNPCNKHRKTSPVS